MNSTFRHYANTRLHDVWWKTLRRLHRCERGAGYSVSVVLLIPIYIAYMSFVIEMTLMTNSQQALTTSLKTASHAVQVWLPHRDALDVERSDLVKQVHTCTARSLMSFVTTNVKDNTVSDTAVEAGLQQAGLAPFASARYGQKVAFVQNALRMRIIPGSRSTAGMEIYAEYDSPLWLPFLSPLFATGKNEHGYFRTIHAQTWLPLCGDDLDRTHVGIPYSPILARQWKH